MSEATYLPETEPFVPDLVPVEKLSRDIRQAIKSGALRMNKGDVRFLVDLYYQVQDFRKACANQERSGEEAEPFSFIDHMTKQFGTLEGQIRSGLSGWCDTRPVPAAVKSLYGFGEIIAAGLEAHIDITKTKAVSSIWRYAGLDPTCKWEKKTKRPWNARLKVLCWKIGDCIVKFHKNSRSFYGPLYLKRKQLEVERNEAGLNAECAAQTLEERTFKDKKTKAIYESGKLPDGRIELRARRWAVKIFLCHYWEYAWRQENPGKEPRKPYIIGIDGHETYIEPPAELSE